MFYLLWAILLFIASVGIHIAICRNADKRALQAKAFIMTAGGALFVYMAVSFLILKAGIFDPSSLWGLPMIFSSGIIFILLCPIHLCFYVLTQLTSPSKLILSVISKQGISSRKDIESEIEKGGFINTRLNDLCTSGCVKEIDEHLILTSNGQKIAATLDLMQRILGRKVGG